MPRYARPPETATRPDLETCTDALMPPLARAIVRTLATTSDMLVRDIAAHLEAAETTVRLRMAALEAAGLVVGFPPPVLRCMGGTLTWSLNPPVMAATLQYLATYLTGSDLADFATSPELAHMKTTPFPQVEAEALTAMTPTERAESDAAEAESEVAQSQRPGESLGRTFRDRLNELFDARSASSGRTVSNREAVRWMNEHGYEIREPYVSSLRRGRQVSPSLRIIEGLAAYFDVDSATLLAQQQAQSSMEEVMAGGVRDVALRASGLSAENIAAISHLMDGLRAAENLPAFRNDSGSVDDQPL